MVEKSIVAYVFELASTMDQSTGEYGDFIETIQVDMPVVPKGAIRNLHPLYAGEEIKTECSSIR